MYKASLSIKERPSLMQTEYLLMMQGVISSDINRRDFLDWINTSRNRLIFTHGVYSMSEDDAYQAIQTGAEIVKAIEGGLRWYRKVNEFQLSNVFHYSSLYDLEPSIDTFCVEKQV